MTQEAHDIIDFYLKRCRDRLKSGDTEGALADIEEAIKQKHDIHVYVTEALIHYDNGEPEKAAEAYTVLLAYYPDEISGYRGRLTMYEILKDYDRALADANRLIELEPWEHRHYHRRAQIYQNKGDYERVAADYTEVINMTFEESSLAQYYYFRGLAYKLAGESEKAFKDFDYVIRIGEYNRFYDAAMREMNLMTGEKPDYPNG